jgi:alpha-glucosidase
MEKLVGKTSIFRTNASNEQADAGERRTAVLLWLFACFFLIPTAGIAAAYRLTSPDGNLTVSVEIKTNPQPYLPGKRAYYRIDYRGKALLVDSPMGLDFLGSNPLDQGFEVLGTDRDSHDSIWENPFGARREVRDHYNQLKVSLRERRAPNRRMDLIFRAYDTGVAFRYALPEQVNLRQFALAAENTGFYFAPDAHAYALNIRSYTSAYESD